jgi:hypothetical protein
MLDRAPLTFAASGFQTDLGWIVLFCVILLALCLIAIVLILRR